MKKTLFALLYSTVLAGWAQTQTIRGVVTDEASGTPIPGVNVVHLGTNLGTVSNPDGTFRLETIPVGRATIRFSFVGYDTRTLPDVLVTAGKEVVLQVKLTESFEQLGEVQVVYDARRDKTSANNDMVNISARSFNLEETKKFAGALGDPSRMASNFAGVVAANDARNDIVVRGNSPLGMLWQLEGMPIPNPNHFGTINSTGGPVSIINNNNLDKSDFLTGAFPAQYGNANSGVFDLKLRNGNAEKPEFLAQVGFNGFELGAEGPFSKKSKASYLVNYRYSTLGVFQAIGINFGTGSATPIYQDLNFKVNIPVGKRWNISAFGMGGRSNVSFLGNEVDTTQVDLYGNAYSNTIVSYETYIAGTTFDYRINNNASLALTLGYGRTFESFEGDSIDPDTRVEYPSGASEMTTTQWNAFLKFNQKINSRNQLQAGASAQIFGYDLFNKDIQGGVTDLIRVDAKGETVLYQAYVQWKFRATKNLNIIPGLHAQTLALNQSTAVEPRLSARYQLADKHSISAGYGYHATTQPVYTYFVQTPTANGPLETNRNLNFTYSQHLVLGYDWNINSRLRIKAETYYQWMTDVPVTTSPSSFSGLNIGSSFAPSNQDSLINAGTGQNYGMELTVERFFSGGYYYLITGSLIQSRYTGSDGVERNTAFNTGHALNVLGGKEFVLGKKGRILALNLRGTWIGGRYLTPIDLAASQAAGTAIYDESRAFSERQADYFRVDLKVSFRMEYTKSSLEFSLDLQNVTNNQNVFQQTYNPQSQQVVTEYQQGFFPVPTVRYTF
jgi:hypothetical protein